MSVLAVIPAKGHPAKYYFAGTPKAGTHTPYILLKLRSVWAPAFAGVTVEVASYG